MNRQILAATLHCREAGEEITEAEIEQAKEAGLVVVFAEAYFLLQFRGAFNKELPIESPAYISLDKQLICDEVVIDCLLRNGFDHRSIKATFKPKGISADWHIYTQLPHSMFDIFQDGKFFCRGLVLDLNELEAYQH